VLKGFTNNIDLFDTDLFIFTNSLLGLLVRREEKDVDGYDATPNLSNISIADFRGEGLGLFSLQI